MNITDIQEFLSLLEGEEPCDHFGWLRLRKDILTVSVWLDQVASPVDVRWAELRVEDLLDKVNGHIKAHTPNRLSQLCLNPS